jgi:hypothetical protein
MQQMGLKLVVCSLWILGAFLLRGYPWTRRFFAYVGLMVSVLYLVPLGLARLQQLLAFPNEQTAEVPFIGFTVGLVVGPALGIYLGYWAMRNWWCYYLAQAITIGFLCWIHIGRPPSH